eukprot:gene5006-6098_t
MASAFSPIAPALLSKDSSPYAWAPPRRPRSQKTEVVRAGAESKPVLLEVESEEQLRNWEGAMQVLDYFASVDETISEDHLVLNFQNSLRPSAGDTRLLDQEPRYASGSTALEEGGEPAATSVPVPTAAVPIVPGKAAAASPWAFGDRPMWRHLAFAELFADSAMAGSASVRAAAGQPAPLFKHLGLSLELIAEALQFLPDATVAEERAAAAARFALLGGVEVLRRTPIAGASASDFLEFLRWFVERVQQMRPGHSIALPGGWVSAKAGEMGADNVTGHALLHVLWRDPKSGRFSLATLNSGTGELGLAHHPTSVDRTTAATVTSLAVCQAGVDPARLHDSSFWTLLFRPLVFPCAQHGVAQLYSALLPYLTSSPLNSAESVRRYAHWERAPLAGDISRVRCVVGAARFLLRCAGLGAAGAGRCLARAQWALLELANRDLRHCVSSAPAVIHPAEARLVEMAAQRVCSMMAHQAEVDTEALPGGSQRPAPGTASARRGGQAVLVRSLETIRALAEEVNDTAMALSETAGVAHHPHGVHLAESIPGGAMWPLFGRLLPVDVEALAGAAAPPPLVRPVNLALIPDTVVATVSDAATVMRHAERLCTLLANQAHLMRNSILLRLALLHHVFLAVVPLPLPLRHPARASRCFWASQSVRYETQADVLGLLRLLGRHYAAAALAMPADRSLDALRVLTAAAMAAIADAMCRKKACDVASPFCLHYSGDARGPVHAFGFSMRQFAQEAETLPIAFPEHVTALTQVCVDMGYNREVGAGKYLSGAVPELEDEFPEMAALRDTVFLAKLLTVPILEALPEPQRWRPGDAKLAWSWEAKEGCFQVKGFGGRKLDPSVGGQLDSSRKGFWGSIFGTGQKPRCPPSGANASAVAGQQVDTEDDVLHLVKLPDFEGHLRGADSELLLTYLTAPYVRVPLLLQFFASPERISALAGRQLQGVLEAALFEPGAWLPPSATTGGGLRSPPTHIPDTERASMRTPCGLLFNELACSPRAVTVPLQQLLSLALDLDVGKWSDAASQVLLFVLRIASHVEAYMLALLQADPLQVDAVRGVQPTEEARAHLSQAHRQLRPLMENRAQVVLKRYLADALAHREDSQACAIHAHLALIWQSADLLDGGLGYAAVSQLLQAQAFLTAHYAFQEGAGGNPAGARSRGAAGAGKDAGAWEGKLGVPEMALFALFQKFRTQILRWLELHPAQHNRVMEDVVSMVGVTSQAEAKRGGGGGGEDPRHWAELPREVHGAGRFVPADDMPAGGPQDAAKTRRGATARSANPEGVVDEAKLSADGREEDITGEDAGGPLSTETGADVPDEAEEGWEEVGESEAAEAAEMSTEAYEDWLRRTSEAGATMEVNINTGEVTVKRHHFQALSRGMARATDVESALGTLGDESCAEVERTEHRHWVHLVGHRADIKLWTRDGRKPHVPGALARKYNIRKGLREGELWIAEGLEPVRKRLLGTSVQLHFPPGDHSGSAFVIMLGSVKAKAMPTSSAIGATDPSAAAAAAAGDAAAAAANLPSGDAGGDASLWEASAGGGNVPLEVVVVREPVPCAQVYLLVSHGRRQLRLLVGTSGTAGSLACVAGSSGEPEGLTQEDAGATQRAMAGISEPSFVVTRRRACGGGEETHLPRRFLRGALPEVLVCDFNFWQHTSNGTITGYPVPSRQDPTKAPALLRVQLFQESAAAGVWRRLIPGGGRGPEGSLASEAVRAVVTRHVLSTSADGNGTQGAAPEGSEGVQDGGAAALAAEAPGDREAASSEPGLALVNILQRPKRGKQPPAVQTDVGASKYKRVALMQVLERLEAPSHILVWTRDVVAAPDAAVRVSLVELPRLRLSFTAEDPGAGAGGAADQDPCGTRLMCDQHPGLFLSSRGEETPLARLLTGLPHGVLLEDRSGRMYVLASALAKPARPEAAGGRMLLVAGVELDRSNSAWEANLGGSARTYLYPLPITGGGMLTPTLAAAAHLFLMRFLAGQYAEAFRVAPACFTDQPLTPEEAQLFERLVLLADDTHPDAHAVRLHFMLVAAPPPPSAKWNLDADLRAYVAKYHDVRADCRLLPEDEFNLLDEMVQRCARPGAQLPATHNHVALSNRLSVLTVVALHAKSLRSLEGLEVMVRPPTRSAELPHFDQVQDYTCLDAKAVAAKGEDTYFAKLMAGSYIRPDPEGLAGLEGLRRVLGWMEGGYLRQSKDAPGFALLYDMLTAGVAMKLLPDDDAHNWGALLMRLYPPEEQQLQGLHGSILRALAANRGGCTKAPRIEIEESSKESSGLFKFFTPDAALSALPKRAAQYLQQLHEQGELTWPAANVPVHVPPRVVALDAGRAWTVARARNSAKEVFDFKLVAPSAPGASCRVGSVTTADIEALAGVPLAGLGLHFEERAPAMGGPAEEGRAATDRGAGLPFDIRAHPAARGASAEAVLERLERDFAWERGQPERHVRRVLLGFEGAADPVAALQAVGTAQYALEAQIARDSKLLAAAEASVVRAAAEGMHTAEADGAAVASLTPELTLGEGSEEVEDASRELRGAALVLGRVGGREASVGLELLASLLMSTMGAQELMALNPLLSEAQAAAVLEETALTVLFASRLSQALRCRALLQQLRLQTELAARQTAEAAGGTSGKLAAPAWETAVLVASQLADAATAGRHYVSQKPGEGEASGNAVLTLDPRLLVFEYAHDLLLRKEQVALVHSFVSAAHSNSAVCHQMLMGAGKSTVVAPLVALMLADGHTLVTQVVPASLLTFAQSILRGRLSWILHRRVLTLRFSRYDKATPELALRLEAARTTGAIVLAPPGALKSLLLKFLEGMHLLDSARRLTRDGVKLRSSSFSISGLLRSDSTAAAPPGVEEAEILTPAHAAALRAEVGCIARVFRVFRAGVLLMDEVDLLLHPLRSELHWPLGAKLPLDFTQAKMGPGLRWKLPLWLMAAVTAAWDGRLTVDVGDSCVGTAVMAQLAEAVRDGAAACRIQAEPHPVLLDPAFYYERIRGPLAQWALLWLQEHGGAVELIRPTAAQAQAGHAAFLIASGSSEALTKDCMFV